MSTSSYQLFHQYQGEGLLFLRGSEPAHCTFQLIQRQDGSLELTCTLPVTNDANAWGDSRFSTVTRFEGVTNDGTRLMSGTMTYAGCQQQYTLDLSFQCAEFTFAAEPRGEPHSIVFSLVNLHLVCSGLKQSNFPNGLIVKGQQTPLEVGSRRLTIRPLPDSSAIVEHLKQTGGISVTAEVIGTLEGVEEVAQIEDQVTVLCALLTFLYSTRVNWIGFDVLSASGRLLQRVSRNLPTRGYGAHIADESWSAMVWARDQPAFIKNAFDLFEQRWDDWDVYAVINLFTDLRGQMGYLEVAGLQLASCVELIVSQYVGRTGRKQIYKGFDKKLKKSLKQALHDHFALLMGITDPAAELSEEVVRFRKELEAQRDLLTENLITVNRYPFRWALEQVCLDLGFAPGPEAIDRFKRNRNRLVHAGLFDVLSAGVAPDALPARQRWEWYEQKGSERWQELRFMEDFVGKMLLAALGQPEQLAGW